MPGPIKIDKGLEAMEATLTMGGHTATLIRTFGTTDVAGVPLRLVGAYQADDGSPPQSVEIYLGGRFTEIDLGKSKAGDDTEHKYTLPLSYYRRVVDGVDEVEIDMLGPVPRRRRRSLCRDHGHPDRVIGPQPQRPHLWVKFLLRFGSSEAIFRFITQ
jgi:P2 family phage contractile tail tube protein